jgi:DNA-binding IscR family transcriptional regulator
MKSGRFAISAHILALMATSETEWLTSEYISGSVNINPVLIRKEIGHLRKKGLVISKEGKTGGSRLAKDSGSITMADIYTTVRQSDFLGRGINTPNPECPVGKKINQNLDGLYEDAEKALINELSKKTLKEFSQLS